MANAELRKASKRFGTVHALDGVDLEVGAGELVAVLGPNGAGKTTAIRLMLGLCAPDSGEARLFERQPDHLAARRRTGVMLQDVRLPDTLRVREQVHLFSSYYPQPMAFADVATTAGLEGFENRLCGKLSGGQRQRVAFALAICGNPDLLFLDEPTAGLDVELRRSFWARIRELVERGASVLLTTHYLEEADALADRIVLFNRGRVIAEGTPAQIKARAASSRVRCSTSLPPTVVMALRGVSHVRTDKQRIEILSTEPEHVVRELLARDPALSGLEVAATGLEDAFLTLTEQDRNALSEVLQ